MVSEDPDVLRISVTQCRGLTPSGCIVEINPEHPLQTEINKADLEGVAESAIYIVCDPHQKEAVDGPVDQFNPELQTERRLAYKLSLQVPADNVPYSVVVGRIRRQKYGAGYEKDAEFIPACTSMSSYSELTSSWRKMWQRAFSSGTLHRASSGHAGVFGTVHRTRNRNRSGCGNDALCGSHGRGVA